MTKMLLSKLPLEESKHCGNKSILSNFSSKLGKKPSAIVPNLPGSSTIPNRPSLLFHQVNFPKTG